jgi:hypothetical protein
LIGKLRKALPDFFGLATIVTCGLITGALRCIQLRYLSLYGDQSLELWNILATISSAFAITLIGAYAGLRVYLRDPLHRADYLTWLRTTPWTADHPLPLGNLQLDLRDAVFVIAMIAVTLPTNLRAALMPITLYVTSYCLALSLITLRFHARTYCYVLLFACGLVVLAYNAAPWVAAGTALVLIVPARLGAGRHLRRLPYVDPPPPEEIQREALAKLPWPFNLAGIAPRAELSKTDLIVGSLLAGWFVTIGESLVPAPVKEVEEGTTLLLVAAAIVFSGWRLFRYVQAAVPANGIRVRWITRRPIDPHYDQMLIVPTVLLLLAVATPVLLFYAGPYLAPVSGAIATTICLIASLGGPPLSQWQLTCPARLVCWESDTRRWEQI